MQSAWALNNPVTTAGGRPEQDSASLLSLSAPEHVMIDVVKKAEDSDEIVVRMHEYAGIRGKVTLSSDSGISAWQELDLMERPAGEEHTGSPALSKSSLTRLLLCVFALTTKAKPIEEDGPSAYDEAVFSVPVRYPAYSVSPRPSSVSAPDFVPNGE
ncbi:glycosyl hydrolase-related protein [Paenibacillus sp. P25]|nr:glycosyl hydrolase-related protein [Paenibacillus sp. P25]